MIPYRGEGQHPSELLYEQCDKERKFIPRRVNLKREIINIQKKQKQGKWYVEHEEEI